MECLLMSPDPLLQEEEGVFDIEAFDDPSSQERSEEKSDGVVDMEEYTNSGEEQEATWWDLAKDLVVQPALGAAKAFTWPADILKIGMVGESLNDLDELEEAFKKAGKPFDRDKYLKNVAETSQFIPTQELLENLITDKTGVDLKPKSGPGKFINKLFTLAAFTRGSGPIKALTTGTIGAGTTEVLKKGGVNEFAADLIGDTVAGGKAALERSTRVLSPKAAELEAIATKHGLPFPEYLTKETAELVGPKISDARRMAQQKQMGMSSQEAIENIIEGNLPITKLRKQGADLEVLVEDAYNNVTNLAKSNNALLSTEQIVKDIEGEIVRIKKVSPSPSDADKAAIQILENEKKYLTNAPKKDKVELLGPDGNPINPTPKGRTPKEASTEQMVQQIRKYNQNVKSIYKRAEFSGREDAARGAYAFLNNSIRNTIESQSGPDVRKAMKAADSLFAEKSKLDRVEGLISRAFKDGDYKPQKLNNLLNSKQGLIVRRELGDQAVNEIREIAQYGEQAIKATNQLAKSSTHLGAIAEWGPLAGMLLHKIPKVGLLLAAKPFVNNIRGYMLTKPATRTIYNSIVKNAAKGSFRNMAADFGKLGEEVSKDFGSVQEFIKAMGNEDLEYVID